jgi:hypothetical protein
VIKNIQYYFVKKDSFIGKQILESILDNLPKPLKFLNNYRITFIRLKFISYTARLKHVHVIGGFST